MEFKRGDWVEVRDNTAMGWNKRIYLATIEGISHPFCVVSESDADWFLEGRTFRMVQYKYIRPIRPDLKVDDPVIVWLDGDKQFRRHFARWNHDDGRIQTFADGVTSWSFENEKLVTWDHYELP
jgi:hypothetical protein